MTSRDGERWIKILDRLPKDRERVEFCTTHHESNNQRCYGYIVGDQWCLYEPAIPQEWITHWRELPPLPL